MEDTMTLRLIFWVLMLIWFVFGLALMGGFIGHYGPLAGQLLEFVLFLVLGWQVFGAPVQRG
jgi:ABC-type polysaccharide/polyol phosphate export permease